MQSSSIWDSVIALMLFCALAGIMQCCTLSFSNVSTHGHAADVVDSEPKQDVQASASVPVSAL